MSPSSQLPWDCISQGVDTITVDESRRLFDKMAANGNGKGTMEIDQLSAAVTFHVGNAVSSGSWGHRFGRQQSSKSSRTFWTPLDFCWEKELGCGHFGTVYRATFVGSPGCHRVGQSDQVAIKSIDKHRVLRRERRGNASIQLLQREISIHSCVDHDYIVKFHGFYEDPASLHLVLEYFPEGDLLEYMKRYNLSSPKRISIARNVMTHMASAISYLDNLQVSHRDIKPENILVRRRDGANSSFEQSSSPSSAKAGAAMTFALSDFGWACCWKPGEHRRTFCGTAEYLPLELIQQPCRYEAKYVDFWAMGVLTYELLHGNTPFVARDYDDDADDEQHYQATYDMIRNFDPYRFFATDTYCVECDFCLRLLQHTPDDRMSADMALEHEFLRPPTAPPAPALVTPTTTTMTAFASPQQGATVAQRCLVFQQPASRHHNSTY